VTSPTWLTDVLWLDAVTPRWSERVPGAERFIATPDVASARQLLPWHPASVVAVTRRVSDDRARAIQWRDSAAVAVMLAASPFSRRRRLCVQGSDSLIGHVGEAIGVRGVSGVVMCGPPRANQKPVIQLHDRYGRTLAFVKVAWNDLTRSLLTAEHESLIGLAANDELPFVVPPVLAAGTFGASTWLAIGPAGVERRERPDLTSVDRLATAIERTAPTWSGPTDDASFVNELLIGASGLHVGRRAVEALLQREQGRPLALAASHGDFVPWNTLSGRPRPAVWDWERYTKAAPSGTDRIHYRFQIGVQRQRRGVAATLAAIGLELDRVLTDVPSDRRDAHLDWYVTDLLCRYERDAAEQPTPRLRSRIDDLTTVLNQRGVLA
jgi:hypothetical protein